MSRGHSSRRPLMRLLLRRRESMGTLTWLEGCRIRKHVYSIMASGVVAQATDEWSHLEGGFIVVGVVVEVGVIELSFMVLQYFWLMFDVLHFVFEDLVCILWIISVLNFMIENNIVFYRFYWSICFIRSWMHVYIIWKQFLTIYMSQPKNKVYVFVLRQFGLYNSKCTIFYSKVRLLWDVWHFSDFII